MKQQLPTEFVSWLTGYMLSSHFKSCKRLHRALILRLCLWRDGNLANALPGYATPPADGPHGYPAGWSIQSLREIARDCDAATAMPPPPPPSAAASPNSPPDPLHSTTLP